jgi:pimeloyl-ACP methyl ester carboxylesterase
VTTPIDAGGSEQPEPAELREPPEPDEAVEPDEAAEAVEPRRPLWRRALRWAALLVAGFVILTTSLAGDYVLATGATVPVPPLDSTGHYITADGLTTHYEQWGTQGTPIVLVHGVVESAWVWHLVGPMLAAQGYRVYALDVRGYGYTQHEGPYDLAGDTAQLQGFLTALHLDAAHHSLPILVGHSSGAAIIGDLALLHPGMAAKVIFMDGDGTPYGVGPSFIHGLIVDPYATALIRLVTRHPSLAELAYNSACGPNCPPFDAAAWLTPFRVPGAVSALKAILQQQLIGLTFPQEQQIRVPAAIVYGSLDPEMTQADATATAQRLRTGQLISISGAYHLGMLSAPRLTVAALNQAMATPGRSHS